MSSLFRVTYAVVFFVSLPNLCMLRFHICTHKQAYIIYIYIYIFEENNKVKNL